MNSKRSVPLFTKEIIGTVKPKEFKMPSFTLYDESRNLVEHIGMYQDWMVMSRANKALLCKGFSLTLKGKHHLNDKQGKNKTRTDYNPRFKKMALQTEGLSYETIREYCRKGIQDGDFLW
ncbi:hypothetical protein PanWU01x14_187240 [Parasponia andersonii]|uniref:Uncharacterized protein n=1 Tax=Parasponia andersonii TaxID=3476 RepID=A0A2P5C3J9_PARAD|nr:hypothetical protein PanWU01x14_187240 [Parasponia andersonii]